MTRAARPRGWKPRLGADDGPKYLAIADALERDVREGKLTPGDPLPTQRVLADNLGVNFTTITRAYAEARRRGLLTATVGRGTFVANPEVARALAFSDSGAASEARDHELSVNAPPMPVWLPAEFEATVERLAHDKRATLSTLTYAARLGDAAARDAGVAWLRWRGIPAELDRVVVAAGAQHALAMLLTSVARPGSVVLTEALAYPGLLDAAAVSQVTVAGVALDDEGIIPAELDAACARHRPAALFCVPTLQNPTTATMSHARRQQIIEIARRHSLFIVEDDICGPLVPEATPLAALAPDRVIHIASLSKCVAPGLRTAFIHLPTAAAAGSLMAAVRSSVLMVPPLPLAVAAAWIADQTAHRAVADIRAEATLRGAMASEALGRERVATPPGSLHAWLQLPDPWTVADFVAQAQQRSIRVAPADWYVAPPANGRTSPTPAAIRLTIGAEQQRSHLARALQALAGLLAQSPARRNATL